MGLAESDRVIEREYHCPTMWSGGMEPRVAIAQWEQNRLTVWASTQAPIASTPASPRSSTSEIVTFAWSRPMWAEASAQRAHRTPMRGGRHARAQSTPASQAPVLARGRNPHSNTRFETKMYAKVGVKRDMTLHALDVRSITNLGAYHTRLGGLGNQATHIYRIPHLRTEQFRVHTNVPNTGPTRGVGDPQEMFGIESLIDEIASEMQMESLAFRLKNIKRTGDPMARGTRRHRGRSARHAGSRSLHRAGRRSHPVDAP